jgi:chondroitin synthase
MKLVFSITVHECYLAVADLIKNIKFFNPQCGVVIHVNSSCGGLFDDIKSRIIEQPEYENVFLNTSRFDTSKSSFSLHRAHISNYKYLLGLGVNFEYFVLEASNSLYVRFGAYDYMRSFDLGIGRGAINQYWKDAILKHNVLQEFVFKTTGKDKALSEQHLKGCHEGSFYSYEIAKKVFKLTEELDWISLENNDLPTYPTEEIWFQLAVLVLNENRQLRIGNTLTYMPWDRGLEWREEHVDELARGGGLPANKFAIKRVERDVENPIRAKLKSILGY